jgi:DNA-directed RNA polymerase sigma subunit (sigma70/sigma32)
MSDEVKKQAGLNEERIRQIEQERMRDRLQHDKDDDRIRDIEREKQNRDKKSD